MSHEHACLSQLAIERYLLGEGAAAERQRVEQAVEVCESCAAALTETRADNEAFTLRPVAAGIRELWTAPPPARRWPRLLYVAVPLVTAALIAFVWVLPALLIEPPAGVDIPPIGQRGGDDVVRPKGLTPPVDAAPQIAPSLGFYVLEGSKTALGQPGQALRTGDRIQFWYDIGEDATGVIVGIDGRRAVTRYWPESGRSAAALKAGQGHVVESSVVLDDAPRVERFFLCVGHDINVDDVERAAREVVAADVDLEQVDRLPIDCAQASTWIRKE